MADVDSARTGPDLVAWPEERMRALERAVAEAAGWTRWNEELRDGVPPAVDETTRRLHMSGVQGVEGGRVVYRYSCRFAEGEGLIPLLESEGIGVVALDDSGAPSRREYQAFTYDGRGNTRFCSWAPRFAIAGCLTYLKVRGRPFEDAEG